MLVLYFVFTLLLWYSALAKELAEKATWRFSTNYCKHLELE